MGQENPSRNIPAWVGGDVVQPIGLFPASYRRDAPLDSTKGDIPAGLCGRWRDFYCVCDSADRTSWHRPFYPRGEYKGRPRQELLRGNDARGVAARSVPEILSAGDTKRKATDVFAAFRRQEHTQSSAPP